MRLTFLGTRGFIDARTARHRMHASLLVSQGRTRVVVDRGEDWLGRRDRIAPCAVFVTHAHPDHAGGLRRGAGCPVYATRDAWEEMRSFAIPARDRRVIEERKPRRIGTVLFEAFSVEHSLRAPAVGYRISFGGIHLFYAPDLVSIADRAAALRGVRVYLGDGASIVRPILRTRDHARIGHASIRDQLAWCAEAGVRRAIFTHCGMQIVTGEARAVEARVGLMGAACGVRASIASDGLRVVIKGGE